MKLKLEFEREEQQLVCEEAREEAQRARDAEKALQDAQFAEAHKAHEEVEAEAQKARELRLADSRPANKLYCAKKYQNRHFVLQAGIYIHLMRKNVLYKY